MKSFGENVKKKQIGYDRKIPHDLIDLTADHYCKTKDLDLTRKFLHEFLSEKYSNEAGRKKIITILLRIWIRVPDDDKQLRDYACNLLKNIRTKDRIWLHYGLLILAYPFVCDIVKILSTKLEFYDEVSSPMIYNELKNTWGERSCVQKQTCLVPLTLFEWNLLQRKKFKYSKENLLSCNNRELQLWLLATLIKANSNPVEISKITDLPIAFPFSFSITMDDIARSEFFTTHSSGSGRIVVSFKS